MPATAHVDTFARDRLPAREQWPQLIFDLPQLHYPERLNCAGELLDKAVAAGGGERPALHFGGDVWTYRDLLDRASRIAHVLVRDMGLVPGNRVLLRGANTPMMAACWLAVMKAGAIAVTTMPLLRAAELVHVVNKAQISHCLCDRELAAELDRALPECPSLREIEFFRDPEQGLEARMAGAPAEFANVDTAADDICLIAFTSGTTGLPKGTMHFHRDVMAICDCFPRSILKPEPDDIFCGTPPFAFTFGLGGLLLFPLRFGASAVLAEKLDAAGLLQLIQDYRATLCFTAPTSYRAMAERVPAYDLRSLRKCVSAGEMLPASTRRLWRETTGIDLIDGIGSTEMLHIFISAAG
ncbi:MAG: AMP-binding protein, partial [Rhodocyclaceae bacterium]